MLLNTVCTSYSLFPVLLHTIPYKLFGLVYIDNSPPEGGGEEEVFT